MAYYLIDYENVKNLEGIEALPAEDTVIVFYSKNANNLTFQTLQKIASAKASIQYKEVSVGSKNALDFQLSSYLGYIIHALKDKEVSFYIISNDKDYRHIIEFWKSEAGIAIELYSNLMKEPAKVVDESNKISIRDALATSALNLSDEDISYIIKLTETINSKQKKTEINNTLNKKYKNSKLVGSIVKIINPYI